MTMHIVGPALTMNNTRKRQEKITKKKQAELEAGWRERNIRLKEMGLPKETFEQYLDWVYGRGKKTKSEASAKSENYKTSTDTYTNTRTTSGNSSGSKNAVKDSTSTKIPDWAKGAVSSKPSQTYTGTKMIGVATMHKSNMVPIFSDEEAEAVARMRRG